MKKIVWFSIFLIIILILFLFIPVKKAVNYEDINIEDDEFFIYMELKKAKNINQYWTTDYRNESVWVEFNNISFQEILNKHTMSKSKSLYEGNIWHDENNYVVKGDVINQFDVSSDYKVIELDINDWDIMYPIRRKKTWKTKLLSDKYLTIYDFNWISFSSNYIQTDIKKGKITQ